MRLGGAKLIVPVILALTIGFFVGYQFGSNDSVKSDIHNNLPLFLRLYNATKEGDTNMASKLSVMGLMDKLYKAQESSNSMVFRLTTGREFLQSDWLGQMISEASDIVEAERTNFVTVYPEIATNSSLFKPLR